MSNTAIRVDSLGKKYSIRHENREKYVALRDVISSTVRRMRQPLKFSRQNNSQSKEDFWALQDVSFEVKQGDRIGIIGRNGAGKSTILKILSQITEPTTGFVEMRGRVSSLLEVGTGFHPELTGRENIFLNGAILGMTKQDIRKKFNEIVDFAEVERFLDTPVKRYSSGMYVRLAFAVAAHLEPEILIVDEVLAVGDARFQEKCLGKMKEVGKEGRTVIFVSHQMAAIEKLCTKGLLLSQGRVEYFGTQTDTIATYLTNNSDRKSSLHNRIDRKGTGDITILSVVFKDTVGNPLELVQSGQTFDICLEFSNNSDAPAERLVASISIATQLSVPVFLQHNRLTGQHLCPLPKRGTLVCRIFKLPLPPASYHLSCSLMQDNAYLDLINNAAVLSVVDGDFYGSGEVPPITHGVCLVNASWSMES